MLARNGRPVMGDLRYLADTKLTEFGSPLARAQLAAALALLGDRGRAQKVFASAADLLGSEKDDGDYRGDYGSRLRDGAGLLTLASETDNSAPVIQRVGRIIDEERGNRRTSTQEQAWLVLAAQAVARDAEAIVLDVDGSARKGVFYRSYRDRTLDAGPITLTNRGPAPVQAVLTVTGNPTEPQPAVSSGYAVERTYYKLDGTQVQPSRIQQNDRLVVVLKVTESAAKQARILLVDRLPAGLEIDNPKLADSDTVAGLPGSSGTSSPPTLSSATTASSRPSIANPIRRRSSQSPTWSARFRPDAMSIRRRRSRTCTGPSVSGEPISARSKWCRQSRDGRQLPAIA